MAVRTTCAYCGVGCGIAAPAGIGERCHRSRRSRASRQSRPALLEGHAARRDARPRRPPAPPDDRRRGARAGTRRSTWSPSASRETIAEHGPDSVAFYVSGQLLTEDYYVANKLMKGFIGTGQHRHQFAAVHGVQRSPATCARSARMSCPAATTISTQADLIVLVGSNTAWCHPVVFQRIMAARETRGTKLVVIDPRRTETCEERRPASADPPRQRRRAVQRPAGASARDEGARSTSSSAHHRRRPEAALAQVAGRP